MDEHVLLRFDREEEKQLKWPKKLKLNPVFLFLKKNPIFFFKKKTQEKLEKGFYSWNIDLTGKSTFFLMILVLCLIFGICLFPVWPLSAKLSIFYISLVLLYFLVLF